MVGTNKYQTSLYKHVLWLAISNAYKNLWNAFINKLLCKKFVQIHQSLITMISGETGLISVAFSPFTGRIMLSNSGLHKAAICFLILF